MNALTPQPIMLASQARTSGVSLARSHFCWTPTLQKTRCVTGTPLKASCSLPARSLRQGHKVITASSGPSGDVQKEAPALRRLGWISFWTQLSLSVVSAIILSFAVSATMQGNAPGNVSIYFTLFGVITSFLSTFFAWGYVKVARRVFAGEAVTKENVASSLLRNSRVNLWGMGATLLGLQSMTGVLVAKILTTSSTNPYSAAGSGAARAGPAALDLFTVQASANTLLAHFAGLVFTNWLLRLVNEDAAPAKMSNPGKGSSGNTVFPKPA